MPKRNEEKKEEICERIVIVQKVVGKKIKKRKSKGVGGGSGTASIAQKKRSWGNGRR